MEHCELVLVRHLEDPDGYPCGGPAASQCSECGAALCDLHREECELCCEPLCGSCYFLHVERPHAKSPAAVTGRRSRRSA